MVRRETDIEDEDEDENEHEENEDEIKERRCTDPGLFHQVCHDERQSRLARISRNA
jgi:hypothetical protein